MEIVTGLFFLVTVYPAVIGLALGASAVRRGGYTPPSAWIAITWNSIMIGLLGLTLLVGVLLE